MTRPKNPHKLAATKRRAGPHGDGARRPEEACAWCNGTGVTLRTSFYDRFVHFQYDALKRETWTEPCPACSGEERER